MFDVSFTELVVIGVIALIVIGPERLPRVAKTVGHLLGRAQRYVSDVKGDIRREIELDELRRFKTEMDEAAQSVKSSLRESEASLRAPMDEVRDALDQSARDARKGLNSVHAQPADKTAASGDPAGVTATAAFPPAETVSTAPTSAASATPAASTGPAASDPAASVTAAAFPSATRADEPPVDRTAAHAASPTSTSGTRS